MEKAIWLNYDLGVGGDFQNLYSWLDDHEATECGNNTAFFKYDFPDDIKTDEDLSRYLENDISKTVNFLPTNRIYIIRKSLDNNNIKGSFIIGKRKATPWEGFGTKVENLIDE